MIKYILFSTLAVLLFLLSAQQKTAVVSATKEKEPGYRALIAQKNFNDTAWGYIIVYHNKQLIKQFSIPALNGNQPFRNRHDAELAGNLVASKLNHSLRPAISKNELDSLGIKPITSVDD